MDDKAIINRAMQRGEPIPVDSMLRVVDEFRRAQSSPWPPHALHAWRFAMTVASCVASGSACR